MRKTRLPFDPDKVEIQQVREKVSELTHKSPRKAAKVLSDWIKKPAKKTPTKKSA